MRSRLRLLPFLLVATLIIVAGASMHVVKAAPQKDLTLNSRQYTGAATNLGQMYLDGQGPYNLPYSTRVLAGAHKITFIPPSGFFIVGWEVAYTTEIDYIGLSESTLDIELPGEDPTITAIYQKIGLPVYVGGVVLPTNTFAALTPYLALIGLVATAAVAIKKRRN